MAAMIGGDLEGCGPSQPWPTVNQHRFHGADGADALQLRESAGNGLLSLNR